MRAHVGPPAVKDEAGWLDIHSRVELQHQMQVVGSPCVGLHRRRPVLHGPRRYVFSDEAAEGFPSSRASATRPALVSQQDGGRINATHATTPRQGAGVQRSSSSWPPHWPACRLPCATSVLPCIASCVEPLRILAGATSCLGGRNARLCGRLLAPSRPQSLVSTSTCRPYAVARVSRTDTKARLARCTGLKGILTAAWH